MIGTSAFFIDMALPLTWLLIAVAITAVVFRSKKSVKDGHLAVTSKMKAKGAAAILILTLSSANVAFRVSMQMENRSALHNLSVDSVGSIQVDHVQLEKPGDVKTVLAALHESCWYVHTAGDGGWAKTVDLVIQLRSGEQRRYRIGRLLRREGAVIDFISQDPNSTLVRHYGYAFTLNLPKVLDDVGAPLPTRKQSGS